MDLSASQPTHLTADPSVGVSHPDDAGSFGATHMTYAVAPHQPPAASDSADTIRLTLPAHSAYLSILRTATAGLAARLGFTLDEIEDMRIAVDEACAMLLGTSLNQEPVTTELDCTFWLYEHRVEVLLTTRQN